MLLLFPLVPLRASSLEFTVVRLRGKVILEQDGTSRFDLQVGERIAPGSFVQTYRNAQINLTSSGGAFYTIHSSSRVRFDEEPLLLYGKLAKSSTPDYVDVHFYFYPQPAQGQTVKLVLWSEEQEVGLSGAIVHQSGFRRPLTLYRQPDGRYRALTGIDAEAAVQKYFFEIRAEKNDGDFTLVLYPFYLKKTYFARSSVALTDETGGLLAPSEQKRLESEVLSKVLSLSSEEALWDGVFSYPVENPVIISEFGRKRQYYMQDRLLAVRNHRGTDFKASRGTAVFIPNSGLVVFTGMRITTGNTVVIDHGQGVFSLFFHMDSMDVEAGGTVRMGEKIGEAGSTGISTGPHLHWSIIVDGIFVDPIEWVKRAF